ncbi:hypothetical protein DYU05_06980 [Mucilaginibacter terrenus]|uniref:PH domain-containing protein n=1 Tax=Mucilaginibacter terrenus TaxID=2482727 RepID=A0A3E2NWD8_9SPHI|nr:hypothetical protein [Mucilaginibacter terrenus]RFZ85334.1 hypothetical protein DYU05_06980 [Mucilaginibacter terrenus]
MPNFTSKLQYQICEDGEYYDEIERSLEETLALIHNYPWYEQRTAEVDITGPSVTIFDQRKNILKVGKHYGDTFHLYYLSYKNELFERYSINIDDVEDTVKEFFNGQVQLHKLKKQRTWFSQRHYFATKGVNYTVNPLKAFLHNFWICITAIPLTILIIPDLLKRSLDDILLFGIPLLLIMAIPLYCFLKLLRYSSQHLHISRANNEFTFGNSRDVTTTYNKTDITKVIVTKSMNEKEPISIRFIEVVFKDKTSIQFPNLLITDEKLAQKFPRYLKPEFETEKKMILFEI